jgi:hypothetical protein
MTWNRRKSKKKNLQHGKWDTQPGKEREKIEIKITKQIGMEIRSAESATTRRV